MLGDVHTACRGIFDCLVDERIEEVLADVAVGQVPLSGEDGRRETGYDKEGGRSEHGIGIAKM